MNSPETKKKEIIKKTEEMLEEEEQNLPEIKKALKNFKREVNQNSIDNLSDLYEQFINFVVEKRDKKQRLHWKIKPQNWADKKIELLRQEFDGAWTQFCGIVNQTGDKSKDPKECTFAASYTINFPPTLWNELTE